MALKGKNNHYLWHNLQRRYFLQMAKAANYSTQRAEIIMNEMLAQVDSVIQRVSEQLPESFPVHISQPIFYGMRRVRDKLIDNH